MEKAAFCHASVRRSFLNESTQGAAGTVTSGKSWTTVFEVLTVMVGKKETANFTSVPAEMVSHWSKYVYQIWFYPVY